MGNKKIRPAILERRFTVVLGRRDSGGILVNRRIWRTFGPDSWSSAAPRIGSIIVVSSRCES
jgi:hypothetical protein